LPCGYRVRARCGGNGREARKKSCGQRRLPHLRPCLAECMVCSIASRNRKAAARREYDKAKSLGSGHRCTHRRRPVGVYSSAWRFAAGDERDGSLSSGQRAADTWDRLTAKDFTAVNLNGELQTKAEQLIALKSMPAPAGPPPPPLKEQINVYGNAAVRRFQRSTDKSWALEVWIKSPQGWQVAAVQYTHTK